MSELKSGYTTGVSATFAFRVALEGYFATNLLSISKTNKMQNDDLDVTKGCEIVVSISENIDDLELNPISHKPYRFNNIELYAGCGVGVVTKEGLKAPKGFAAINPTPLSAIKKVAEDFEIKKPLFATISVTNGEEIAKNTANAKVGVLGGISILGTTGFVKPISSDAYLDSIETELEFIKVNGLKEVIFTLGNSSLKEALNYHDKEQVVEIGNFIYEGIKRALKKDLDIKLYIGVAKALKVAQGYKNTHNRFGEIDFEMFGKWIGVDLKDILTVKRVLELYDAKKIKRLVKTMAKKQLFEWFKKDIEIEVI
jgi:cobalt-precorrin-5B (C1)-methyltransferase